MGNLLENRTELTDQEIRTLAQVRYSQLMPIVEAPETIEQFITIDVLGGDCAVGPDHSAAVAALRSKHKTAETFTLRIGYTTTYARDGRMERLA